MNDNLNPIGVIIGIILHGIILGIVLAIAWPVKQGIDLFFKTIYRKAVEVVNENTKTTVNVDENIAR